MKTLTLILLLGTLLSSSAQLPPYRRNPATTNSPAGLTNVIRDVMTHYGLLMPQYSDTALDFSYSVLGPNAPSLVVTTNNGPIQGLAFDNNDILYASGRFPHNVAETNADYPNFYWVPHVHWTPVGTLDATHSNVTWRIEWEIATTNGLWNVRGTNTATVGIANNFRFYKTSFGAITNAVPPGHDAGIRARVMRPASVAQEYSTTATVLFDGLEIRVPVGNNVLFGHPTEP